MLEQPALGGPVGKDDVFRPHADGDLAIAGARHRRAGAAIDGERRLLGGEHDAVLGGAAVEEVHRRAADEAGDIGVLRLLVEFGRAADLLDAAAAHHHDAVAHAQRLDLVVGDVEGRHRQPLLQLDDLGAHLHAQRRVEVGQRLVHQEHARLAHDRPAERHALALTARQLPRTPAEDLLDAEDARRFANAPLDLILGRLPQPHAEGHVGEHVQVREQGVVLEHHRHVALVRQLVGHVLVVEQHLPFRGDFKPGDHPHGRRLAAAGRPDKDDEFAILCGEREILDGDNLAIALPQVTKLYLGHWRSPPTAACVRKSVAALCFRLRCRRSLHRRARTVHKRSERLRRFAASSAIIAWPLQTVSRLYDD